MMSKQEQFEQNMLRRVKCEKTRELFIYLNRKFTRPKLHNMGRYFLIEFTMKGKLWKISPSTLKIKPDQEAVQSLKWVECKNLSDIEKKVEWLSNGGNLELNIAAYNEAAGKVSRMLGMSQ